MRRIIKYVLVVLGTISVAVLIYQFRALVLLLAVSLALTATTRPLLKHLRKYRVPGFAAQLLIIIIMLASVVGFAFMIGHILIADIQHLTNNLLIQYSSTYEMWEAGASWQQMIADRMPEPGRLTDNFVGKNGELLMPAALDLTQNLVSMFSSLFIILAFSLYWAQDEDRFINFWLSLLPAGKRTPLRNAWLAVEKAVGRYIRHEFALGLVAAVLLGNGYALLGLPYSLGLAILAFIGWFIPLLGLALILIPVFLTALGSGWLVLALSIGYTLLIFMGLKYWVEPKYLHPQRYSSFLIVFWILVLGSIMGLAGYFAGPLVAVASQTVWGQYLKYRSRPQIDEVRLADIRERYAEVIDRYAVVHDPSPRLESLMSRLERTFRHTEMLTEESTPDG